MLVIFQSLVDEEEPPQHGILTDDGKVWCLCGCDGYFEPDDYRIIEKIPNVNINSLLLLRAEYPQRCPQKYRQRYKKRRK